MAGELLDVEKLISTTIQMRDEKDQRRFGGVSLEVKHRFTSKQAPDRHAINTADKLAFRPNLHAVRMALAMVLLVGFHHARRNPGVLASIVGGRATFDDRIKILDQIQFS